jgi:hypothetical protein
MYYLLNIYGDDCDPKKSIICLGEKSKKLLKYQRIIITKRPQKSEKYGYEYIRNRTSSIFMLWNSKRWEGDTGHRKNKHQSLKLNIDKYLLLRSWRTRTYWVTKINCLKLYKNEQKLRPDKWKSKQLLEQERHWIFSC